MIPVRSPLMLGAHTGFWVGVGGTGVFVFVAVPVGDGGTDVLVAVKVAVGERVGGGFVAVGVDVRVGVGSQLPEPPVVRSSRFPPYRAFPLGPETMIVLPI